MRAADLQEGQLYALTSGVRVRMVGTQRVAGQTVIRVLIGDDPTGAGLREIRVTPAQVKCPWDAHERDAALERALITRWHDEGRELRQGLEAVVSGLVGSRVKVGPRLFRKSTGLKIKVEISLPELLEILERQRNAAQ